MLTALQVAMFVRRAQCFAIVILLLALLFLLGMDSGEVLAQESTPVPVVEPLEPRLGVIESHEAPAAATALGVGWTRIIFHWGDLQADGPDSWQPPLSDTALAGELAAGRQVVGLLIGIPQWARDADRLPRGLARPVADPANSWARFVERIVADYRGRIDHWIVWNEPDIGAEEIAHTWDGSVADFAQLQRTAYLAAKAANPEAIIHLAATTFWADYYAGRPAYLGRLLDELAGDPAAAQHNHYFDVATAHLYFQPNQIYQLLTFFQNIMRRRGLDQPIWLVETNAPPHDDPSWPVPNWTLSVTQAEQAAFMPQALAAALAAGAERVAVYKLQDTETDRQANPEPFGLLRLDGQPRPAFTTYQVAVRQVAGWTRAERERWNEVGQVRVDQPSQTTTVLFARLPQPQRAEVAATAPRGTVVDQWGASQPITATDGIFSLELPAARCSQPIGDYCMIGGPTFYLVQAAPTPTASAPATGPAAESPAGPATESPAGPATESPAGPATESTAGPATESTAGPATAQATATPTAVTPAAPPPTTAPPSRTAAPVATAVAAVATVTPAGEGLAANTLRPGAAIWLWLLPVLLLATGGAWWWWRRHRAAGR
ncbi:MAG: hypothetical protein R3300_18210 [Candidatus Promineifilaceae bacterium]|nr:hypothetical protein [Candidatus Promineifilaceae bacterium]